MRSDALNMRFGPPFVGDSAGLLHTVALPCPGGRSLLVQAAVRTVPSRLQRRWLRQRAPL